jgi:hypothetical protein
VSNNWKQNTSKSTNVFPDHELAVNDVPVVVNLMQVTLSPSTMLSINWAIPLANAVHPRKPTSKRFPWIAKLLVVAVMSTWPKRNIHVLHHVIAKFARINRSLYCISFLTIYNKLQEMSRKRNTDWTERSSFVSAETFFFIHSSLNNNNNNNNNEENKTSSMARNQMLQQGIGSDLYVRYFSRVVIELEVRRSDVFSVGILVDEFVFNFWW